MEFTEFTQSLAHLRLDDVQRLTDTFSLTSSSKRDKGYKFFIEQYLFDYEVKSEVSVRGVKSEVSVRGRCHKSMKKNEEAHYLQVTLDSEKVPVVLKRMSCSCSAGKALCNHLIALLFQTAHFRTMGFKTVPLPLSCTSSLQTWHRPRTQGIAPEATNDMMVSKPVARKKNSVQTGVKCTLYRAYSGPLPDPQVMASGERLKDIRPQPGRCKLLNGLEDLNLVLACLKKSHKYYYQVQGQLALSGLQWCDFITDTHTDFTVERIFRDEELIHSMRQTLDYFYHNFYIDVLSCRS